MDKQYHLGIKAVILSLKYLDFAILTGCANASRQGQCVVGGHATPGLPPLPALLEPSNEFIVFSRGEGRRATSGFIYLLSGCQSVAKNASFARIFRIFAAFKFQIKIPQPVEDAGFKWVQGLDLNQGPSGYEPDELPGCSTLQ